MPNIQTIVIKGNINYTDHRGQDRTVERQLRIPSTGVEENRAIALIEDFTSKTRVGDVPLYDTDREITATEIAVVG